MELMIKAGTAILQVIYQLMKLFPVRNKITMISRQSNDPSIDFVLLKEEIEKRSKDNQVIILCKTLDGAAQASMKDKLSYMIHMFVQMYHIATSRIVLLDTYCIVASLLHHRKSLKIVQMWHSMGTMKLFGYTAVGSEEGRSLRLAECMHMHDNYDFFVAASENYKDHLAKGFNCDSDKAFICPLPRYDLLRSEKFRADKQNEIYGRYPELKKNKKILYCPTFRKDETGMKKAMDGLIKALPEGFELIVKVHPLSKLDVSGPHVWTLEEFTTFDALFVADYVISDYSCVIYEAGVLRLPLCFYVFDLEEYENARGLAISFRDEVKGVISSEPEEIMVSIRENRFDMDKIEGFIDKYIETTENATEKLADFLIRTGRLQGGA